MRAIEDASKVGSGKLSTCRQHREHNLKENNWGDILFKFLPPAYWKFLLLVIPLSNTNNNVTHV